MRYIKIAHVLPLTFVMMLLGTAFAQGNAVSIPILNPHFDVDKMYTSQGAPCSSAEGGNCYQLSITGWTVGPQTLVQVDSATQFPGVSAAGLYVAALGGADRVCAVSGSILQTLSDTLQANTTYTLRVKVGARADYPFTGYNAALMAGNVTLASGNKATPAGGTFVTETITFNSGASPAQLGKPLQILITSTGPGQANIADVSLTANSN
ncbi:MAG: hypothetical protein ABSH32_14230 [Bryobacteraceae bacterium]|jgi:hypothetical protein